MAFTDIATTADVRAVLGVSAKELPDSVLATPTYMTLLTESIRDLHAQMLTDYAATVALDPKTDAQQRFVDLLQAYGAHHVANQCLGAVAMFAPMLISAANKSQLQRVADPYQQLRTDVPAVLNILRSRLRSAYAALNPDATPPSPAQRLYAMGVTPTANPITG